jgi:hypothetical protein
MSTIISVSIGIISLSILYGKEFGMVSIYVSMYLCISNIFFLYVSIYLSIGYGSQCGVGYTVAERCYSVGIYLSIDLSLYL